MTIWVSKRSKICPGSAFRKLVTMCIFQKRIIPLMFYLSETDHYLHFTKTFFKVPLLEKLSLPESSSLCHHCPKHPCFRRQSPKAGRIKFSCFRTQEDNNETVTSRYSDVFSHERLTRMNS